MLLDDDGDWMCQHAIDREDVEDAYAALMRGDANEAINILDKILFPSNGVTHRVEVPE